MGRWDTPFKVVTRSTIDPFGDVTIAGITRRMNDQGNFDRREQNVDPVLVADLGRLRRSASCTTANEGKTATAEPVRSRR